jgi:heme A synthase
VKGSRSVSTPGRRGLHRCAVAAAGCGLLTVLSGAIVTSGAVVFTQLHEIVAGVASVVIAILSIWMVAKHSARFGGAKLGWTLLAILLAEGALGPLQQGPAVGVLHACLGQILFALTVAAVVYTSSSWTKKPELVEDHGWPSLGSLGRITPVFVLGQIALGAAFRHKALGVMPHLVGAMLIVLLILCICIFVMQQFPEHKTLRPGANALMAIGFTQLFLGIAAFTVRTMTTIAARVTIGVTSAHATVGALTLAAAVILQMQIRRNVRPHREEEETAD